MYTPEEARAMNLRFRRVIVDERDELRSGFALIEQDRVKRIADSIGWSVEEVQQVWDS